MTIMSKTFHFFLKGKITHRVKICIETFKLVKFDNISLHSLSHEFLPNLLSDVIFVTLCGVWPVVSKKYIFKTFFRNLFFLMSTPQPTVRCDWRRSICFDKLPLRIANHTVSHCSPSSSHQSQCFRILNPEISYQIKYTH